MPDILFNILFLLILTKLHVVLQLHLFPYIELIMYTHTHMTLLTSRLLYQISIIICILILQMRGEKLMGTN